jgi:hypothetical protein
MLPIPEAQVVRPRRRDELPTIAGLFTTNIAIAFAKDQESVRIEFVRVGVELWISESSWDTNSAAGRQDGAIGQDCIAADEALHVHCLSFSTIKSKSKSKLGKG